MLKVALTANLQKYYPNAKFEMAAGSVRELLKKMDQQREGFSHYILEDDARIRKHVNIFVNGELIDKSAIDTKLSAGTQVHIMQALSGG